MTADIIDKQLPRIRKDLVGRGITYEHLRDDLLDHICCMVEEKLEEGEDFETSYTDVMSGIEPNTLFDLQHETLLLLDRKFQRMKRITYILGLTGSLMALVGAFFKTQHWPGAGILLTLGFLIVVLGFLPLYFISSYREQSEKPNIIFPIVGYISLLIVFTGAVFKMMHWPGANVLLRTSVIVLLVGFLPLYVVQIFKRSVKTRINPAYVIMLLLGIAVVVILWRVNISKNAIDDYTDVAVAYQTSTIHLENRIDDLKLEAGDSLITPGMQRVMTYAGELEALADEMLDGLLMAVGQAGVSIETVKGRDARNVGREAFYENGLAQKFLETAAEFREYVLSVTGEQVDADRVRLDLLFASDNWIRRWDPEDDIYQPLIVNYARISEYRYRIIYAEYLTIRQLLN